MDDINRNKNVLVHVANNSLARANKSIDITNKIISEGLESLFNNAFILMNNKDKIDESINYFNLFQTSQYVTISSQYNYVAKNNSDYLEALSYIKTGIVNSPVHKLFYLLLGIAYSRLTERGKAFFFEALEGLSTAIELDPNFAVALRFRGHLLRRRGVLDRATEDFTNCIKINEHELSAYLGLALIKHRKKDVSGAISDLERVIHLEPNHARAFHLRGYLYLESKQFNEAMKDLNNAIRLDGHNPDAYELRGKLKFKEKDFLDAKTDLDSAIQFCPSNYSLYNSRGYIWFNLKDYEKASSDFKKAITLNPINTIKQETLVPFQEQQYRKKLSDSYLGLGLCNLNIKDYSNAIKDFDNAIELTPDKSILYQKRGFLKFKSNEFKGAISDFDMSIELDSHAALNYYLRSICKKNLGDRIGAEIDLEKYEELKNN